MAEDNPPDISTLEPSLFDNVLLQIGCLCRRRSRRAIADTLGRSPTKKHPPPIPRAPSQPMTKGGKVIEVVGDPRFTEQAQHPAQGSMIGCRQTAEAACRRAVVVG
jgi:hypothetical protein